MFSKSNSRFLTLANVLLLGQVVIGVIYFLFVISQLIFPAGDYRIGNEEWVRTLAIVAMGVVLILAINRKKKQVFSLRAVREEKIFKFVTLAVFDIAACIALSYFLSIPMETNQLSVQAVLHVATSSAATAATFLALFLLIPRLKVFCESFSWVLNYVLLAILVGLGWGVAWLLSVLLCGPDGSSQVTQAVYAQQIFRFAVIAVFLAGLTLILVKNGMRLSGGKVALRTAARRGQKLLGAEQMVENRELRAEVSELKKEVAGLKDELAGRKETKSKAEKSKTGNKSGINNKSNKNNRDGGGNKEDKGGKNEEGKKSKAKKGIKRKTEIS